MQVRHKESSQSFFEKDDVECLAEKQTVSKKNAFGDNEEVISSSYILPLLD